MKYSFTLAGLEGQWPRCRAQLEKELSIDDLLDSDGSIESPITSPVNEDTTKVLERLAGFNNSDQNSEG